MAHRSRLSGFIIDCNTDDLDAAADFWSQALGCSIADRNAGDATADYQMFGDTPGDLHIEVHRRLPISLTFDHRACTGGEAARFLAALLDDLSQPT